MRIYGHILIKITGGDMFNDNWYLFLLIVMLAFFSDGEISSREAIVMLAILFALTITNVPTTDEDDDTSGQNCFCNHSI